MDIDEVGVAMVRSGYDPMTDAEGLFRDGKRRIGKPHFIPSQKQERLKTKKVIVYILSYAGKNGWQTYKGKFLTH